MLETILDLYPDGPIAPKPNGHLHRLMRAFDGELEAVRIFIKDIQDERQPSTATGTLAEWLELYQTSTRELAQAYHTSVGGQDVDYITQQVQTIDTGVQVSETLIAPTEYGQSGAEYGAFEYGGGSAIIIQYPLAFTQAQIAALRNLAYYIKPAHIPVVIEQAAAPAFTITVGEAGSGFTHTAGYALASGGSLGLGSIDPASAATVIRQIIIFQAVGYLDVFTPGVAQSTSPITTIYIDDTMLALNTFGTFTDDGGGNRYTFIYPPLFTRGDTHTISIQRADGTYLTY